MFTRTLQAAAALSFAASAASAGVIDFQDVTQGRYGTQNTGTLGTSFTASDGMGNNFLFQPFSTDTTDNSVNIDVASFTEGMFTSITAAAADNGDGFRFSLVGGGTFSLDSLTVINETFGARTDVVSVTTADNTTTVLVPSITSRQVLNLTPGIDDVLFVTVTSEGNRRTGLDNIGVTVGTVIPEPVSAAAAGLIGLVALRRRR